MGSTPEASGLKVQSDVSVSFFRWLILIMSLAITVILCDVPDTMWPPGAISANVNAALASFAQHQPRRIQGCIGAFGPPGRAVAVAIPLTFAAGPR